MKRAGGFVQAAAALLLAAGARAAPDPAAYFNLEDFSSEALYATGLSPIGARAAGMGGAFTAVADDATALDYNPAGLAQLVHIELTLGLQHRRDRSTFDMFGVESSAESKHSGLDHALVAYPFPTYRGSLVAAFGLHRARLNELEDARRDQRSGVDFTFDDLFRRAQRGGLWRFAAGLGVDLLENLSFGAGAAFWHGGLRDDQFRSIDELRSTGDLHSTDRLTTDATLNGFSFDLGLLGYAGRTGRVGLVLRSPAWYDIEGDGTLAHDEVGTTTGDFVDRLVIDQNPRSPWSMALGASWGAGPLLVSAETRYTAWDEIDLDAPSTGPLAGLPGERPPYTARLGARAGFELSLRQVPIRLRGGYAFEPLAYDLLLGNPARRVRDHHALTVGGGVLLSEVFALDLGAEFARFERADRDFPAVAERRSERRFYLSGAYRY